MGRREEWRALLRLASDHFDVVFTVNRGMEQVHAQVGASVGLVILAANTTDPVKIRPLMPKVRTALQNAEPGKIGRVDA